MVVPTIGRPSLLRGCLESLAACEPPPAEVVVVDQSSEPEVGEVVAGFSSLGARTVRSDPRGPGPARNEGIAAAASEFVAVTDDDCTVSPDWIETAGRLLLGDPEAIYTGTVLAPAGAGHVPSTIDLPAPLDYSGQAECRALYSGNMAFAREALIEFGGFDARLSLPGEDNDLCYRWLRAGHQLRYEPALRVTHHDWRSPEQLKDLYVGYGRGQGAFYAKHLRAGDLRMLRFLAEDLVWVGRASLLAILKRDRALAIPPWLALKGLPHGVRWGWRSYAPGSPGAGP